MSELNKLDRMIDLTKENINQLLWIGINNNDENIKNVYGGERGLKHSNSSSFAMSNILNCPSTS